MIQSRRKIKGSKQEGADAHHQFKALVTPDKKSTVKHHAGLKHWSKPIQGTPLTTSPQIHTRDARPVPSNNWPNFTFTVDQDVGPADDTRNSIIWTPGES
jgi:hypothetical protein